MKNIFVVLAMVLGVSAAHAQTAETSKDHGLGQFELAFGLGATRHSGYLSDKDRSGDFELAFRFYNPNERGMWEIFMTGTETEARSDYGFTEGVKTKIAVTGIGPTILFPCEKWRFGVGVGYAIISVNDKDDDNQRSFGDFYWSGQVQYQITSHWQAFYSTRWMSVQEKYNSQETFFEMWMNNIGAAYKF